MDVPRDKSAREVDREPRLAIQIDEVVCRYADGTQAVDQVSLAIQSGELIAMVGASGSGKTTLLKLINRLIPLSSGTILVQGRNILTYEPHQLRRGIGYVFQGVGLFPHRTVSQNIATVPRLLGWPRGQIRERVGELLELVGLDPAIYASRLPVQLSGGQAQRVGLARALAARPGIMLLDEPLGAVDPLQRDQLREEYRRLHDVLSLTSVMVTHDMTEALLLADRIVVMRRGRVICTGTPRELLLAPAVVRPSEGGTASSDDEADAEYVEQLLATPRRNASAIDRLLAGGAAQ